MIAIIKISGNFYARDLEPFDDDEKIEYIEGFIIEGNPVTLVNEIDDALELFNLNPKEIQIIND